MPNIRELLANPVFENLTITQSLDHCIKQDPKTPRRFIIERGKFQDDEELVRHYAEKPEITEGLWRMHQAGKLNCTCEAIAMHFEEFEEDTKELVLKKLEQLF
ncbi:hypothetical protein [Thalassoroseus pseudoceratinae]|uniref:hypothetical protein n=1 Tax=Thalassoroseus pseudoceratinae TaxID=2713176 RepID=UPI00141EBC41|nr:hypothetical protein [Thalassoroseus pseudoceratinae]